MIAERICRECGRTFAGGPRAWYCPECRYLRAKVAAAGYRRNGPTRKLGSADTCAACGGGYVVTSGMQRYCPDCSRAAVMAVDRRQGLAYYAAVKGTSNPARNAKRRKTGLVCVVCGATFDACGKPTICCSDECRRENFNRRWRESYHRRKKQGRG